MKGLSGTYQGGEGIGVSPPVAAVAAVATTLIAVAAWSTAEKPMEPALSAPAGAPCPAVSRDTISRHFRPRAQFAVGGVTIVRQAGDVSCEVEGSPMMEAAERGDTVLCQFSAPVALAVRTEHAEFDFAASAGQVASVFISHHKPRCVLAAPHWAALSRALAADMHAPPSP